MLPASCPDPAAVVNVCDHIDTTSCTLSHTCCKHHMIAAGHGALIQTLERLWVL